MNPTTYTKGQRVVLSGTLICDFVRYVPNAGPGSAQRAIVAFGEATQVVDVTTLSLEREEVDS
jgi:hypothetical protein